MNVDKKFNERLQDLILYAGGKEEAGERLGISVNLINQLLEMEEAPNDAIKKGVEETIDEIQQERVERSLEQGESLEKYTPPSGKLDRAITFFDGSQIQNQITDLEEELKPDESYQVGLQIYKEGKVYDYSFYIDGEDLLDARNWESIAWEQFRTIADDFGSEIAVNVNSLS